MPSSRLTRTASVIASSWPADLLESCLQRYGMTAGWRPWLTRPGSALEGLMLQHPFEDRQVPIILGEHVTLDAGTGAVHTAPGHGQEDFAVGQRYGLTVANPVGNDGRFYASTPLRRRTEGG